MSTDLQTPGTVQVTRHRAWGSGHEAPDSWLFHRAPVTDPETPVTGHQAPGIKR